jgi:hypothetical protein
MRGLRSTVTAAAAVAAVLLGLLSGQPAGATVSSGGSFPQPNCSYDSPSGKVRIWWTEKIRQGVLTGDDTGVASDGRCSTVPESVPWMADQVEGIMRGFKAQKVPMPPSDKGIQRLSQGRYDVSDDGSGAYDVFVSGQTMGTEEVGTSGITKCTGYYVFRGGAWRYRTVSKMVVFRFPAGVPDADRGQYLRGVVAHELVHASQCSIAIPARRINGTETPGPWTEAVPNALAAGLVGGRFPMNTCGPRTQPVPLNGDPDIDEYGDWPFWYSLLGAPSGSAYTALLRERLRYPQTTEFNEDPRLARLIRKRFTDQQLTKALLTWATRSYFGGTLPSASGVPITWGLSDLDAASVGPSGTLTPAAGGSASTIVRIKPLTCAGMLVDWPEGAQTLSVGATGAPGGDLASVMAAGLDVAPGSPPTVYCASNLFAPLPLITERTVVPLVGGQFTATRPCTNDDRPPQMWVLMANGGSTPLTLTVTATAT